MENKEQVLEVLKEARRLLARPFGWRKFDFHKKIVRKGEEIDCYCALGALRVASGSPAFGAYVTSPAYLEARAVLEDMLWKRMLRSNIPAWNDDDRTKKKDVLAVFDEAIAVVGGK